MKWFARIILLFLIGIGWLILPLPVLADTTADITITATGVVVGAASGFTVTYIDDYTIGMSWINPLGADSVKIIAKYGEAPDPPVAGLEPTDGWVLYEGNGTYVEQQLLDNMYYLACAEVGGIWSPLYTAGVVEQPIMTALTGLLGNFLTLLIAGALIFVAFWQRSNFLQIIAGFVAIGFGIYWITVNANFLYVIEAVAVVGVGLYMMLMVGVEFLRGK